MDDGGGNASAVPLKPAIDILHDLLAPLMLEIDVDVGWFIALFGQKARKQQVVGYRVNRCDAKQVTDHRICSGTTTLAQYRRILRPGELDDVMHRQKIAGIVFLAHQSELFLQRADPFGG